MAWCCMWCLECFNEKSNLTRHVNGKHQEASFNCKKCSFTANRIDNVRRHENGKHKKDNYSCSECSYFSDRKDNLTRHKKTYRASQKKLLLYVLLDISGSKQQNYKPFFPPENWYPCANFEYRTISMRFKGAEILTKQNRIFEKGNCNKLLFSYFNFEVFWKMIKMNTK